MLIRRILHPSQWNMWNMWNIIIINTSQ